MIRHVHGVEAKLTIIEDIFAGRQPEMNPSPQLSLLNRKYF